MPYSHIYKLYFFFSSPSAIKCLSLSASSTLFHHGEGVWLLMWYFPFYPIYPCGQFIPIFVFLFLSLHLGTLPRASSTSFHWNHKTKPFNPCLYYLDNWSLLEQISNSHIPNYFSHRPSKLYSVLKRYSLPHSTLAMGEIFI